MIIAAEEVGVSLTERLLNTCMSEGSIPEDWKTELIVPIWKGEGDVQYLGNDALKSCNEGAGEDSGWEDKEEWRS